jgi:hypothetical protein
VTVNDFFWETGDKRETGKLGTNAARLRAGSSPILKISNHYEQNVVAFSRPRQRNCRRPQRSLIQACANSATSFQPLQHPAGGTPLT